LGVCLRKEEEHPGILLTLWFCMTRQLVLSFLMRSGWNLCIHSIYVTRDIRSQATKSQRTKLPIEDIICVTKNKYRYIIDSLNYGSDVIHIYFFLSHYWIKSKKHKKPREQYMTVEVPVFHEAILRNLINCMININLIYFCNFKFDEVAI
jgi:hypothetical protein